MAVFSLHPWGRKVRVYQDGVIAKQAHYGFQIFSLHGREDSEHKVLQRTVHTLPRNRQTGCHRRHEADKREHSGPHA